MHTRISRQKMEAAFISLLLVAGILSRCPTVSQTTPSAGQTLPFDHSESHVDHDARFFQVGDTWDKRIVTAQELANAASSLESDIFRRSVLGSVSVSSASGFYLGEYQGEHLVATNFHVCRQLSSCRNAAITFPFLKRYFWIKDYVGGWPDIDLALVSISVETPDDAKTLSQVALSFAFDHQIGPGQKLITLGFGATNNPLKKLAADSGSDCEVFSAPGNFRMIASPTEAELKPNGTWSFLIGCDVSRGDSGSPVLDRETGDIVGLVWGGQFPKEPLAQSSAAIRQLRDENSPALWSQLNYAVPAPLIRQYLMIWLKEQDQAHSDRSLSAERRKIIESLLRGTRHPPTNLN